MSKILFFNFDGTDNEPDDAVQDKNYKGDPDDNGITNILKFHLMLGGNLKEKTGHTILPNGSRSFYYHGVGTYGNYFERKFNAGLALEATDVKKILRLAKNDFDNHYGKTDEYDYIVLTGFSRGAALARRFAALINDKVGDNKIIIEGVFDTVASFGLPNLRKQDRPKSDVVFEEGCTLPSNVLKALHLVSLDEKRHAFQPTLMNQDGRVTEVWFSGAHSDVGGGYNFDGLSDTSLRFFLDWFEDLDECDIQFKSSKTIEYNDIFEEGAKQKVGVDDMQMHPNVFGINHQQKRTPLLSKITLTDRVLCIIKEDKIVQHEKPIVFESVAQRIGGSHEYRPKSLANTNHTILYRDGSQKSFVGYSDHKLSYKRHLRTPDANGIETKVFSHLLYNHTGIVLQAGEQYRLQVVGLPEQKWRDASLKPVDGLGWSRDDIEAGFFKEAAFAVTEPFRRVTGNGVQWFTLCGCIGENDDDAFIIGNELASFSPKKSGELCAFANDLKGYYGNNSGYLKLKVTKL